MEAAKRPGNLRWVFTAGALGAAGFTGYFLSAIQLPAAYAVAMAVAAALATALMQRGRRLTALLLAAFILRVIVATLQEYVRIFPYPWDEDFFHELAVQILEAWDVGTDVQEIPFIGGHGNLPYGSLSAAFYALLGASPITMRLVNAVIGSLGVFYTYRASTQLPGNRSPWLPALAVCFTPSLIVFTSLHMRDALVLTLTLVLACHFLRWMSGRRALDAMLSTACILGLGLLRPPVAVAGLFAVGVVLLTELLRMSRRNLLAPFLVAAAVVLCLVGSVSVILSRPSIAQFANLERLETERDFRSRHGSSAYLQADHYETWTDVFLKLPARSVHFMFGPLVTEARNTFLLVAGMEGLVALIVSLGVARAFYRGRGSRESLFLLVFVLASVGASAVADSNYGTAARHRMTSYALLWILGSLLEPPRLLRRSRG